MNQHAPPTQDPRTEQVTFRVSDREKSAVRLVAAARKQTESDVLRDFALPGLMAEYDRITAILSDAAA